MSKEFTPCSKRMYRDYGSTSCTRRGVIEEDGKMWCKQHAPSSEKARKEGRDRKWKEMREKEDRERERRNAIKDAKARVIQVAQDTRDEHDSRTPFGCRCDICEAVNELRKAEEES